MKGVQLLIQVKSFVYHAVVASVTVIRKDILDAMVVVGNPAHIIKRVDEELDQHHLHNHF